MSNISYERRNFNLINVLKLLFKEEEEEKSCLNCGARNTEWCKRLCSSTDLSEWIPKE